MANYRSLPGAWLLWAGPTAVNVLLVAGASTWDIGIILKSSGLWFLAAASCLVAASTFGAYFANAVDNRIAWSSITANGLLSVVLFALLHSGAGIVCTADICTGSHPVLVDSRPICDGTAPEDSTAVANACDFVDVYRDDIRTGLYFSIVTFTTLGYGDLQPWPSMRLLAAMEATFGYVYLGLIVGAATHWGSSGFPRGGQRLNPSLGSAGERSQPAGAQDSVQNTAVASGSANQSEVGDGNTSNERGLKSPGQ